MHLLELCNVTQSTCFQESDNRFFTGLSLFGCLFVRFVLRANSGSNSVREHWFEICKSGVELHPWERSCDISQWPRGNVSRNPYFDAYIFITLRI